MKKCCLFFIFGILLFLLLILSAYCSAPNTEVPISISVHGEVVEQIRIWKGPAGENIVFLPSYCQMSQMTLHTTKDMTVTVNGVTVVDGMPAEHLDLNQTYELTYTAWGREVRESITFVRSANVPTMYVDTETGSMEYVYAKKGNGEAATVRIYSPEGRLKYEGNAVSIQGRGNTTWDEFEKKPYNLELEQEADLLSMGSAAKWVLLANAGDPSHIRNKMIYEFARNFGMMYSPDSDWVDLYLNGEYAGLYLLCEKNEIHSERVDLSPESGVLVSKENANHLMSKTVQKVTTAAEQAFRIHHGKDTEAVLSRLQSVENAITAENHTDPASGKTLEELIDLESWARKYLVEELFGNIDAGHASQFYYWQGAEGKVYAGPVWDYDNAVLGNTQCCFFANQQEIKAGEYAVWNYALYHNEIFRSCVKEIYETEARPLAEMWLKEQLPSYTETIEQASRMDQRRWQNQKTDHLREASHIEEYLTARLEFLSDVWFGKTTYCTVRFDVGNGTNYLYYAVKKGACLEAYPEVDESELLGWYYEETGESFDISHPITEDTAVAAKWKNGGNGLRKVWLELIPIIIVAALFMILLLKYILRIRKSGIES